MWWKMYFWIITLLLSTATILVYFTDEILHVYMLPVDTILIILSGIGLYSYAYAKTIFKPIFWKYYFYINILYLLLGIVYLLAPNHPVVHYLSYIQSLETKTIGIMEIVFTVVLLSPLFYALLKLSEGKFRKIKEKFTQLQPGNDHIHIKTIEYTPEYTVQDIYNGIQMYYEDYRKKIHEEWLLRIFGLFIVLVSLLNLYKQVNFSHSVILVLGLLFIFAPLHPYYYKLQAYMTYFGIKWFCLPGKILIDEQAVSGKFKFPFSYSLPWIRLTKFYVTSNLLVLGMDAPYLPFIPIIIFLPKKGIEDKDLKNLIAFAQQQVNVSKSKQQNSKQYKFLNMIRFVGLIILTEFNLFIICILLATYFSFVDTALLVVSVVFLVIAVITPFLLYLLKLQSRLYIWSFSINILLSILIFIAFSYVPQTSTPAEDMTQVEQKFTANELWEAVNDKREEYNVPTMKKNKWACKVANIELRDSLKLGNGEFTSYEAYGEAIDQVKTQYRLTTSIQERLPNFLMEYATYGLSLEDTIQSWEAGGNKLLFLDKKYTLGCAVAKDGYGIVVTAEEDPPVPERQTDYYFSG